MPHSSDSEICKVTHTLLSCIDLIYCYSSVKNLSFELMIHLQNCVQH
jgi:hypothetical protein